MEVTVSAELTVSLSPVLSLSGQRSDPETTGEAELSTPQQSKTLNWSVRSLRVSNDSESERDENVRDER